MEVFAVAAGRMERFQMPGPGRGLAAAMIEIDRVVFFHKPFKNLGKTSQNHLAFVGGESR